MISERLFAAQFTNFWRSTLPNLEAVTRSVNLGYERISEPVGSRADPARRDLVSEAGYYLFFESAQRPNEGLSTLRPSAVRSALEFLRGNIVEFQTDSDELSVAEASEVDRLAGWLRGYFVAKGIAPSAVTVPKYRGHGIIGSCSGDFEFARTLVEMKYVDRQFRSHDLKQIIIYSALRYFESKEQYEEIRIINPLNGIEFTTDIDELIYSASGSDTPEFFQKLSYTISSGEVSH